MRAARNTQAGAGLRLGMGVFLVLAALWLLRTRLADMDTDAIWQTVAAIPLTTWTLAGLLSGVSFWAVGRYDAAVHQMLGSALPQKQARWAGRAAIALSQVIGFGLISGAFMRWQWGRGAISAARAAQITALAGACFLPCAALWILLLAPVLPVMQGSIWAVLAPASAVGVIAVVLALSLGLVRLDAIPLYHRVSELSLPWRHRVLPNSESLSLSGVQWPSLMRMARLMGLTAIDLGCAALAFWVLLPDPDLVSPLLLCAAYSAALILALVSNAPGGIGPFDLALLMLVPQIPEAQMLATCLAFRVVYYALPALLAGGALLARLACVPDQAPVPPAPPNPPLTDPERLLQGARNAETCLANSPGKVWLAAGPQAAVLTAPLPQTLVALFDPLAPPASALGVLNAEAARLAKIPALYKCSAPMALAARSAGWHVMRVASDAVLNPATFTPDTPGRRQLRRKLRKAEKAGLHITHVPARMPGRTDSHTSPGPLPLPQIRAVDQAWTKGHGSARGFSMSRPGEADLTRQQVFLIWQGPKLMGYCSFHATSRAWALDLMPQRPEAPDGAMHLALHTALCVAKAHHVPELTLAAIPALPDGALAPALRHLENPGLRQFKSCFDPQWRPLYLAAPGKIGLGLAGLEIARAITAPAITAPAQFTTPAPFASQTQRATERAPDPLAPSPDGAAPELATSPAS